MGITITIQFEDLPALCICCFKKEKYSFLNLQDIG